MCVCMRACVMCVCEEGQDKAKSSLLLLSIDMFVLKEGSKYNVLAIGVWGLAEGCSIW